MRSRRHWGKLEKDNDNKMNVYLVDVVSSSDYLLHMLCLGDLLCYLNSCIQIIFWYCDISHYLEKLSFGCYLDYYKTDF